MKTNDMNGKVTFALIGSGKMGKRWASIFLNRKDSELVVICDNGSGKAQELASQIPRCKWSSDVDAILEDKSIDAIIVAVPHNQLALISRNALRLGKHVLCEKPGAIKSIDIKNNDKLAKKKELTYMIAYNHPFHDGFVKAFKFFNKGTVGELLFIRAKYGFGGRSGYDKEWRLNKQISGGGHLIDMGVHLIDISIRLIGSVKQPLGFISDNFWNTGSEENAFVLLKGKNNTVASLHTSLTQWKPTHLFEIYGSKGYLTIEGLGPKYGGGERLVVGKPIGFSGEVNEKTVKCIQEQNYSLKGVLNEFISAIKKKKTDTDMLSNKRATLTLKIVESIYNSNTI